MELIDYFLEPAIPFGIVLWAFWYMMRDEIRDAFSKEDER